MVLLKKLFARLIGSDNVENIGLFEAVLILYLSPVMFASPSIQDTPILAFTGPVGIVVKPDTTISAEFVLLTPENPSKMVTFLLVNKGSS